MVTMIVSVAHLVLLATIAAAACVPVGQPGTTSPAGNPPASSSAPAPPAGTPTTGSVRLHPNGNTNWCLEVQGNVRANGTPVQLGSCKAGSAAQAWIIKRGSGQVKLAGANFCLDTGSSEFTLRSPTDLCRSGKWGQDENLAVLLGPRGTDLLLHG